MLLSLCSQPFQLTEYRNASTREWHQVQPFIYSDGSTSPPEPLRKPGDPNYLSKGMRITGWVLAGIGVFVCLLSLFWLVFHRHHRVVVASQPFFLYCFCAAPLFECASIVLLSFDEGSGWTADELSGMCIAVPWLIVFGHIITFNMLFTKVRTGPSSDASCKL